MKKSSFLLLSLTFLFGLSASGFYHCEIPCGIYNDEMRFELIMEHIQTIEKAIQEIKHLSAHNWKAYKLSETFDPVNYNQLVRWINNKEKHAEEIQHIISQYFLTQRIKWSDDMEPEAQKSYYDQLSLCHKILVYAMKTKQSLDSSNVEALKKSVADFKKIYLELKK
jgi:nickel superoxide dismutase